MRESLIEKAQKKAAQIKRYIKKSYDITSVGKAVWKLQAIPALLYGKQIVTISKKLINKLQAIENSVYRYILGVGSTTPVTTLRGEVGASKVETRVIETIMMFTRETLQGSFAKVKSYMEHELETGKGRWASTVYKYRQEIGIGWNDLREINKKDMKIRIREREIQSYGWKTCRKKKP